MYSTLVDDVPRPFYRCQPLCTHSKWMRRNVLVLEHAITCDCFRSKAPTQDVFWLFTSCCFHSISRSFIFIEYLFWCCCCCCCDSPDLDVSQCPFSSEYFSIITYVECDNGNYLILNEVAIGNWSIGTVQMEMRCAAMHVFHIAYSHQIVMPITRYLHLFFISFRFVAFRCCRRMDLFSRCYRWAIMK